MSERQLLQVGRQRNFHRILPFDVHAGPPRAPTALANTAKSGTGRQTTSLNATFPEGDPAKVHAGQEISPDGHKWPVGRDYVLTAGT